MWGLVDTGRTLILTLGEMEHRGARAESREGCDRECSQAPLAVFGAGQEEAAVTAGGWWSVEVAGTGWIC